MKKHSIIAFSVTVLMGVIVLYVLYGSSLGLTGKGSALEFSAKTRIANVAIVPESISDSTLLALSAHFEVIQVPDGFTLSTSFAQTLNYQFIYESDDIVFEEWYIAAVSNVKARIENISVEDLSTYQLVTTTPVFEKVSRLVSADNVVLVDSVSDVYSYLDTNKAAIGLVMFNDLNPQYRALNISGVSIFDTVSAYPLTAYLVLDSTRQTLDFYEVSKFTNRDPALILTVTQTGVTAITRSLAAKMEALGDYDWPSQGLAEYLSVSDIAHTSNEVSFVDGCVPINEPTFRFCSHPNYIETFSTAGIDIVELTGNHNNDYGASWNTATLDMYDDLGMQYFGGGRDADSADDILYITEKETTIAFIGYNFYDWYYGNSYALATDTHAGANPYGGDETMKADIEEARANADIVIVDFQFQECWCYPELGSCYLPIASPNQRYYFELAADYGADIVVGAQAHTPQVIENYDDSVIFYGLGNVFFDQQNWKWTREAMIVTHIFYDGQYLSSIVHPIYYEGSSMQPQILWEGSHREALLDRFFQRY